MTTEIGTPARVLLVGKRVRVLDELGTALRAVGMVVREETDVDRATTGIDGASVDVLALGRTFTGSKRDRIVTALRAQNPRLKVVEGLAPIPELMVAQVREAVGTPDRDNRIVGAAAYERGDNSIVLILRRAANLDVTLYRLDPMYRVHRLEAFTGPLGPGKQRLPLGRRVGRGERFLVVQADQETTVHPLG
ncbi:hypothetical protein CLV30_108139 [Haloactinopolyspora alba]|uniref:Uncharacterized protein n=1 Tax=Haloactinopolyspora alba TaxID=648780 RepID=A0A2P8E1E7_9ACTN|nr:hypothetical protein [Haloactinopolyspora alba]PSL03227.1 hypothetical protein CLV30_108139 [Haloactinopolyspora alba]